MKRFRVGPFRIEPTLNQIVLADGERFVMVESEDDPSALRLYVVLGFWEER